MIINKAQSQLREKRINKQLVIVFQPKGKYNPKDVFEYTTNISASGLMFVSSNCYDTEEICFQLYLPIDTTNGVICSLPLTGEVIWHQTTIAHARNGQSTIHIFGVKFTDISNNDKNLLKDYINLQ